MYTDSMILFAIERAKSTIIDRNVNTSRYIRGYNDCFSLLLEYEKALRGDFSLAHTVNLSYSDSQDFLIKLKVAGFKTLQSLSTHLRFSLVEDKKPKVGDIAFEVRQGKGMALLATPDGWLSTLEKTREVSIFRSLRSIELRPLLHARPQFVGE